MSLDNNRLTWEEAVQWLRSQPDQEDLVRASYYDDPLLDVAERYWRSLEWQHVRSWLRGLEGKALDVGAGRGIASYALTKDGFSVTALEPNGSGLVGAGAIRQLALEAGVPIEIVQDFSEVLQFPNATFDVVFARAVLHHTQDLRRACAEFSRVLKPGGKFIAIREHVISHQDDLQAFLMSHPLHRLYGGENAFLLNDYLSALRQAGLHIDKVLAPLESPINFAPHTADTLKTEISRRFEFMPGLPAAIRICMGLPGGWRLIRLALGAIDRRPGRLYSFICTRPEHIPVT